MDDRIKLAEARGWTRFYIGRLTEKQYGHPPGSDSGSVLPDPFTDANDDYAVLEWMRDRANDVTANNDLMPDQWNIFTEALPHILDYEVGAIARAALKVIKGES